MLFCLAENTLFEKKIQENYANVQFSKAYLGFPNFSLVLTPLLIALNTFGSHIAVLISLYGYTYFFKLRATNKKNRDSYHNDINNQVLRMY